MNGLIDFLIRASISLSLLYLVYWFFLRKETLFRVNRYYLIFSLVISIVLPLIRISYSAESTGSGLIEAPGGIVGQTGLMGSLEGISPTGLIGIILGSIYFLGVTFFMARLTFQVLVLVENIRKNGFYVKEQVKIVENSKYNVPFSFFHFIFINPQYINTNELDNIIAHEKVHIRENHWFDLLIVELINVFFWFNPFVWLFDRSIKQNHEYLADEGVIAQGYSIGRYHSILLNQLLGMEVLCMANHLNYSLNAKRLKMIKREKTPKLRALHIIWALPALVILLVAFAKPVYTSNDIQNDGSAVTKSIEERNIKLSIMLKDLNGDPIPGANGIIKGTEIGAVSDKDGKIDLTVSKTDIVVISFVGFENVVINCEKLKEAKNDDSMYGLTIKMKPSSENLSDEKKKELIKKKEVELKKKQLEQENSKSGDVEYNLIMKLKEVENMIKELALKEKKIQEMEKEGSVDKEKLDAMKKEVQAHMVELKQKRAAIEKELDKQK